METKLFTWKSIGLPCLYVPPIQGRIYTNDKVVEVKGRLPGWLCPSCGEDHGTSKLDADLPKIKTT